MFLAQLKKGVVPEFIGFWDDLSLCLSAYKVPKKQVDSDCLSSNGLLCKKELYDVLNWYLR